MRRKSIDAGFTLMEIMAATAVLSIGIVLIYEAFFSSLNTFDYCSDYLKVVSWADEKIWQAQDGLGHFGPSPEIQTSGNLVTRNKSFDWDLSYSLINSFPDLYKIDLRLSRSKGKRKLRISRTAYAIYEEE
ncbi:type II secretion system protein J [Candidatus Omnitrophota bacterium]